MLLVCFKACGLPILQYTILSKGKLCSALVLVFNILLYSSAFTIIDPRTAYLALISDGLILSNDKDGL